MTAPRHTIEGVTETCWRCAAAMEWRHGTWQCPRCRFKLGCCEGEPQSACELEHGVDVAVDLVRSQPPRR